MSSYTLVLFVHIATATVLVGGSILAAPAIRAAVRRSGRVEELRTFLSFGKPLEVINPMSAILVMATGAYLSSVAHWWTLGWIQVSVAVWVANSVVARAVVTPALHLLTRESADAADGPIPEVLDAMRWSPRWSHGTDMLLANDVATLFLMTVRPGLPGSVAVVLVANAVVLATGHVLRRSRRAGRMRAGSPPLAPAAGM